MKYYEIVKYGLEDTTVRWIHNWQNDCIQRMFVNDSTLSWKEISSGCHRALSQALYAQYFYYCLGWENWVIKLADNPKLGE